MTETPILIIGASVSGLATAVSLQRRGMRFIIIEKDAQVATPWRNHYKRLHLHTSKGLSNLPYKKFAHTIPRYPGRGQVLSYLESYQQQFKIAPLFNTTATSVKKEAGGWITTTNNGSFRSQYIIVATGAFAKPRKINIEGLENFNGRLIHSGKYITGADFKGQEVLVIGFGNSACEIAIDLHEQGAVPSISVRSPVNVIPRDVLGIPVIVLGLFMRFLPARIADTINEPLLRLLTGDITKLGLKKLPYGPLEQIKKDGTVPVLDIGTLNLIRKGDVKLYPGIEKIQNNTVHFKNGIEKRFDSIIAATGYERNYADIIDAGEERVNDLRLPAGKQQYFGKDGLYFCGFWISPAGQFREIALDAKKIAKDISRKSKKSDQRFP